MRPSTAISADGPMNLLNAVRIAADPQEQDRGVLVAMNDQINAGRDVTKTNTTLVNTFSSHNLGYLGVFTGGKNHFFRKVEKLHIYPTELWHNKY